MHGLEVNIIQLLTIEALDMMWYSPEKSNIDQDDSRGQYWYSVVNIYITSVDAGVTTGNVTKSWYSLEGIRKPLNIRYIHWAENSSQPMKDSLFLGYIMINVIVQSSNRGGGWKQGPTPV